MPYPAWADASKLATFLQGRKVKTDSATTALSMAAAALYSRIRATTWPPNPIPDDLWAWHLELAGLIYDNPTSADRISLGRLTVSWGTQAAARATAILDAAEATYGPIGTSGPQGSFPAVSAWPDPACTGIPWLFS